MQKNYEDVDLSALRALAHQCFLAQKDLEVIYLEGEIGSGKTTFCQYLLAEFGVTEPVVSPTYQYVQEYDTSERLVVHIDGYRFVDSDYVDLPLDQYLDEKALFLIEWPNRYFQRVLPPSLRLQWHASLADKRPLTVQWF